MASDNSRLEAILARLDNKVGAMWTEIQRQIQDLKISTIGEFESMRHQLNIMEIKMDQCLSNLETPIHGILNTQGDVVSEYAEVNPQGGIAMVAPSVAEEDASNYRVDEKLEYEVPADDIVEANLVFDAGSRDMDAEPAGEVKATVSENVQRVESEISFVDSHDNAGQDEQKVVFDSASDTVEEKLTVGQLRDQFWWIEKSEENPRWPFKCIIREAKIAANVKQLRSHDKGAHHGSMVLKCNSLQKLERFQKINLINLASYLRVDERKIFFLTPERKLPSAAKEVVEGITFFNVSFQSHEAHVTELALLGGNMCICFQKSLLSESQRIHETIGLLKVICEDPRICIVGKDVWMMMVLLFKDYKIVCRNCYSIHDVLLARRPVGVHVLNPIITLVANAMAIREVLPNSSAFK